MSKAVVQLNQDYTVLNVFDSVPDASRALGIAASLIYGVLNGIQKQTHGFYFVYEEELDQIKKDMECNMPITISFKNGVNLEIPSDLVNYIANPNYLEIEC